jgi:hypothetical protein
LVPATGNYIQKRRKSGANDEKIQHLKRLRSEGKQSAGPDIWLPERRHSRRSGGQNASKEERK